MTWSINKGNLLPKAIDMESSYFLSDASNLTFCDIWLSKMINECCFTMINMSHDGDYRWFFDHSDIRVGLHAQLFIIDDAEDFELLFIDV